MLLCFDMQCGWTGRVSSCWAAPAACRCDLDWVSCCVAATTECKVA